jgi:Homeodomain-like domain
MFEKIPRKNKQQALILNAQGVTEETAAKACGISERTLRRAKAKHRKFGDIEGGGKQRGRPTTWIPAFKDVPKPSLPRLICRKF